MDNFLSKSDKDIDNSSNCYTSSNPGVLFYDQSYHKSESDEPDERNYGWFSSPNQDKEVPDL